MPQKRKKASAASASSGNQRSQHRRKRKENARRKRRQQHQQHQQHVSSDEDARAPAKGNRPRRLPPTATAEKAKSKPQKQKRKQEHKQASHQVTHVRVSALEWNRPCKSAIRGYVHVPSGIPFMTRNCKAIALERKRPVYYYVKSSAPTKRLGIQVPQEIFDEVHARFLASASDRANLRDKRDSKITVEASEELKQLFPRMPNADAKGIVERGWERYSGRVGRGNSLSLEAKLLLATWAYIRHSRTDYDRRLNSGKENREGVRRDVRKAMLAVWKEWGGDEKAVGRVHSRDHKGRKGGGGGGGGKPPQPRVDPVSGLSVGRDKRNLLAGALQRSQYLDEQKGKGEKNTATIHQQPPAASKPKKTITSRSLAERIQIHGRITPPTGSATVKAARNASDSLSAAPTKSRAGRSVREAIVIESDSEEGDDDDAWDRILEGEEEDGDDGADEGGGFSSAQGWLDVDDDDFIDDDEFTLDSDDEDEDEDDDDDDDEDDYDDYDDSYEDED